MSILNCPTNQWLHHHNWSCSCMRPASKGPTHVVIQHELKNWGSGSVEKLSKIQQGTVCPVLRFRFSFDMQVFWVKLCAHEWEEQVKGQILITQSSMLVNVWCTAALNIPDSCCLFYIFIASLQLRFTVRPTQHYNSHHKDTVWMDHLLMGSFLQLIIRPTFWPESCCGTSVAAPTVYFLSLTQFSPHFSPNSIHLIELHQPLRTHFTLHWARVIIPMYLAR